MMNHDWHWRLDQLWLKNQISDMTYLHSLFFCGYDAAVANQQLQLLKSTKENGNESQLKQACIRDLKN